MDTVFLKIATVVEDCPVSNTAVFFLKKKKKGKPKKILGIQTSELCLGARINIWGEKNLRTVPDDIWGRRSPTVSAVTGIFTFRP